MLDIRYKILSSMANRTEEPSSAEQELYEKIETTIHEFEQKRDSFVQQKLEEEWKRETQEHEEEWKREMHEHERDELKDYPEDLRPFFKVLYGTEDSGEDGADHVHKPVVDPVGDLWMP